MLHIGETSFSKTDHLNNSIINSIMRYFSVLNFNSQVLKAKPLQQNDWQPGEPETKIFLDFIYSPLFSNQEVLGRVMWISFN